MPDWFYRTVSRPVLFRLPAERARGFALGFMGALARLPLGPQVIDFLGHMRADGRLRRTVMGVTFPTPVGLGPRLDVRGVALPALARFGVGFLEVGPVMPLPSAGGGPVERRPDEEALYQPCPPPGLGVDELAARLGRKLGVPLVVRLGHAPNTPPEKAREEGRRLAEKLAPNAAVFSLTALAGAVEGGWPEDAWRAYVRAVAAGGVPVVLVLPPALGLDRAGSYLRAALAEGAAGVLVDGVVPAEPGGELAGPPAREMALKTVRELRECFGPDLPVLASGGVHEPEHALAFRAAGADLVQVDTGLVYTGPGLPKRVNEALLYAEARAAGPPAEVEEADRPAERTWFWTALMGAGMVFGSLLALVIAATRVVLPYDEAFVGMTRAELHAVNPRLLAFMAHDRVSLAGTMVAVGIVYLGLSLGPIRAGVHWAQQSVFWSAFAGFGSFFLFLGFGYFDPFHAFVSAVLFQFLLLGLHAKLGPPPLPVAPDLTGDWRWRRALWGQLLLVVHGCGVIGAGVVICGVGVTTVFVHEDLEFMGTTAEALKAANPRLVPLVAHDRATFGGMLVATGLVFLLPALWGFRRRSPWLWWTLLAGGGAAYAAAIGVHYAVGYTDVMHLAPAFAGLGLLLGGLALAYPYLCCSDVAF